MLVLECDIGNVGEKLPPRTCRRLVGLAVVFGLAAVVWAVLLAAIWTRLGGPEIVALIVLAALLFAPKLPRLCRWLARR